jgi:hypothetical protein
MSFGDARNAMKPIRSFLKLLFGRGPSRPSARSLQVTGQPSRRSTLKLIGYWAPAPHWSWARSDHDQHPPWPDVRQAVRAEWRVAEREKVVAYLRSGHYYCGYLGFSACRFECRTNYSILGSREQTDGEWVWPEGLAHYAERHGIMVPDQFVVRASARGWKVPPKDQIPQPGEAEYDYSFWLQWAKSSPMSQK